uniref:Uncharacterized protein n=1 Tax=Giant panda associated circular DNA virus TaxID=2863990 RepID=A0A8K1M4K4_9VIRU|nr:hypothetical protein [Giant panda associated circular DNA virus]
MTDDSVQEIALDRIRRATALADGIFEDCTMSGVPQPELGPKTQTILAKVSHVPDLTTQVFMNMPTIDVSSGEWVAVPIWQQTKLKDYGLIIQREIETVYNPAALHFDNFLGCQSIELKGNSSIDRTNRQTHAENRIENFWFSKWKGTTIKLGNFALYIERDSSGGIQMRDNPIYEVQLVPIHDLGQSGKEKPVWSSQALGPVTTWTSDLSEGLTTHISVSSGLEFTQSHVKIAKMNSNDFVYVYRNVNEWLRSELPTHCNVSDNAENLQPVGRLEAPLYMMYIRLVNAPRGITNWKLTLSYTAQMTSHFEAWAYLEDYISVLPPYGTPFPGGSTMIESQKEPFHNRNTFYSDYTKLMRAAASHGQRPQTAPGRHSRESEPESKKIRKNPDGSVVIDL